MKLATEPIVILGTFRSGTSALATALNELGVFFGAERDFYPANEFNPGGFWELKDMQVLNAKCLAVFGMNFYQVEKLPNDWKGIPGALALVGEIRSLLHTHFEGHERWGWKEPSTSVLMPIYEEAIEAEGLEPIYAISVRHPLSVAASQRRRQSDWGYKQAVEAGAEGVAPVEERTLGLWIQFTLASLKETHGRRRLIVNYEDFLENPKRYLEALTRDLKSWRPTESEMHAAAATVKPEWSHSRHTLEDLKGLPPIVSRVYDCCLRADLDPTGLNSGAFDAEIDQLWEEWTVMGRMMRPSNLLASPITFTWREGGETRQETVVFTPTGTWQTIRMKLNVPAGTPIQIDLYQSACQIWIRNADWHVGGEQRQAPLSPGQGGIIESMGVQRLTVFGPGSLLTKSPNKPGEAEFEVEFLVQSDQSVLTNVVGALRTKLEQLRRSAPHSFTHTGRR